MIELELLELPPPASLFVAGQWVSSGCRTLLQSEAPCRLRQTAVDISRVPSLGCMQYAVPLAVLLVAVSALLVMGLFRKNHFHPAGKHCYIGGGSEGLGLALACELAQRGAHISIVSRSPAKLALALAKIEVRPLLELRV